jgi:integrase
MALSDTAIKAAKPHEKPYKRFDTGGLYLEVRPTGAKWWRFRYRFSGKDKLLSLGVYPDVALKQARQQRDDARKLVANGIDPSQKRKADKAASADTFEGLAREWHAGKAKGWKPAHAGKVIRRLERHAFPYIGGKPINAVTKDDLLAVIRRIEGQGLQESQHRVLFICGQIFRYAAALDRADRDPTIALRGVLPSRKKMTAHYAAITDPKEAGALLLAIDAYQGTPEVKAALRLAPLVFVRPGELRHAEWAEIDLDRAEWNIPATRMKMGEPHLVPLSSQAVEILRELQPLTGSGRFVFPGARTNGRPMSENAVNVALRYMGYPKERMTGHGFRAMARTILDEVLNVRPDLIEHQLAHAVRDPLGRAYNRTKHLPERRKMMQQWADYLDALKNGATVVPFRRPA